MQKLVMSGALALLLSSLAQTSIAHHAAATEFDLDSPPIELQGTVVKMEWINPHSWITIEVENDEGDIEIWEIEAGAPNAMFRRGFNRDSLPPGTVINVMGYQARDGGRRTNGRELTFQDGTRLFLQSPRDR